MPGKGNKVSYVENDEPSFIKRFKERIGYKEGPNVETKRELPDFNDEDEEATSTRNKDDEKPTVVVLKNGDLTSEEAEQLQLQIDKEEPAHNIGDKIVFKQPKKRQAEEEGDDSGEQVKKSGKTKGSKNKQKSKEKKQKKNSLLSFDEEEEDDT